MSNEPTTILNRNKIARQYCLSCIFRPPPPRSSPPKISSVQPSTHCPAHRPKEKWVNIRDNPQLKSNFNPLQHIYRKYFRRKGKKFFTGLCAHVLARTFLFSRLYLLSHHQSRLIPRENTTSSSQQGKTRSGNK